MTELKNATQILNRATYHHTTLQKQTHTHTHGSDESTKAEKNNYCVSFLAFKKDYYMLWMKYNLNTVQKMIESRTKKRRWRAKWTNVEWARTKKSIFFRSQSLFIALRNVWLWAHTCTHAYTLYCYCTMCASWCVRTHQHKSINSNYSQR